MQLGDANTPVGQVMEIETGSSIGKFVLNSANAIASIQGGDLSILTDIELIAGTLLDNGNDINLSGKWDNTGGAYTGSSSVTLVGANQDIFSGTTIFNNLVLAGSGTKTMQDNLSVAGDVTLNAKLEFLSPGFQLALGGDFINNNSF